MSLFILCTAKLAVVNRDSQHESSEMAAMQKRRSLVETTTGAKRAPMASWERPGQRGRLLQTVRWVSSPAQSAISSAC